MTSKKDSELQAARSVFGLFGPSLVSAVEKGFERFRDSYGMDPGVLEQAVNSWIVRDLVVDELRRALVDNGAARFACRRRIKLFVLGDFLVRVKKLDDRLRASYNHTLSSVRFEHQEELFGFPPLKHVYLGYVVDDLALSPSRILIVRPAKDPAQRWHIELSGVAVPQVELFSGDAGVEPRPGRVRLRQNDALDGKEAEN